MTDEELKEALPPEYLIHVVWGLLGVLWILIMQATLLQGDSTLVPLFHQQCSGLLVFQETGECRKFYIPGEVHCNDNKESLRVEI